MNTAHELGTSVLHCLRIKGRARTAGVATALGAEEAAVQRALEQAATDGLATQRSGRLAGWLLTPEGRKQWSEHSAAEQAEIDMAGPTELYDAQFLALNSAFKKLCARWQLERTSSTSAAVDGSITTGFEEIHRTADALLGRFAALLPRFALYQPRLEAAIGRFRSGESAALLQPFTDSYHDVWLELHEDLLLLLGKEREEDD
ncbi:hypothetical protein ACGFWI_25240 [Streptomyces sp. NPDC048434]|uniref:hypothetical protein n=1 Tax=Streptomyces sp. NPDC048434 TaxID=3365549 RepID=UPI003720F19E